MAPTELNETDVGKHVVADDGTHIGVVSTYRSGRAYVEPDQGTRVELTRALDLDNIDDEAGYPLYEGAVAAVTDESVQLEADT